MCFAGAPVNAQTPGAEDSDGEATTDETGVSMDFLEFLGTWESGDGEWVDPTDVQSADWPVIGDDPSDTGTGNAQ